MLVTLCPLSREYGRTSVGFSRETSELSLFPHSNSVMMHPYTGFSRSAFLPAHSYALPRTNSSLKVLIPEVDYVFPKPPAGRCGWRVVAVGGTKGQLWKQARPDRDGLRCHPKGLELCSEGAGWGDQRIFSSGTT